MERKRSSGKLPTLAKFKKKNRGLPGQDVTENGKLSQQTELLHCDRGLLEDLIEVAQKAHLLLWIFKDLVGQVSKLLFCLVVIHLSLCVGHLLQSVFFGLQRS